MADRVIIVHKRVCQEMADAKAEISEKHDMLEKTTPLEAVEDEDGWSRCNVVAIASHLGQTVGRRVKKGIELQVFQLGLRLGSMTFPTWFHDVVGRLMPCTLRMSMSALPPALSWTHCDWQKLKQ